MKTPSFLLNFPLLKQELTLAYHFRSLFAIGCSATASTFAFFNRLQASPKKRMVHGDHEEALDGGQAEKGHQAVWNPEKGERNPLRLICSSIASQPLVP